MENNNNNNNTCHFQMFFPCSSSSSSTSMAHLSSTYPISSNINFSSQANYNNLSTEFGHQYGHNNRISPSPIVTMRINNGTTTDDHDDDYDHATMMIKKLEGTELISNNVINSGTNSSISGKIKKGSEKKIRKPKYAFQTRSQVDILDDGYRWRKYGQKAVKNNKFPRSYYRCTHQGCNVKKQVQRLTKDEEIVVTTYEGMHNHPIEKHTDNFEHILNQMQIYTPL